MNNSRKFALVRKSPGRRHWAARATALASCAAVALALAGCSSASSANPGGTASSGTSGKSVVGQKSPAPKPASSPSVPNTTTSCKSGATKITFWAWVPGISRAVDAFNASHPSICVALADVGAGSPEYTKLAQALKAGSGAPDVAEVEYDELPSFEITHSVVDLSKYGAAKLSSDFVPWVWKEVSQGAHVYAMPGDAGPMAFYYNSAAFKKYNLTPPKTWAQFASEALKVHKEHPSVYMTNFSATDLQWVLALMSQNGSYPFSYTGGSNVGIDFTGPKQMAFARYWQKLIDAHAVNMTTDVATGAFSDMDNGTDISWLSSAWGPSYFAPDAKKTLGDWRAAPLPQWTTSTNVAANWGGSSYPVFAQSKHPQQAAEFAIWLNDTMASWKVTTTAPSSLFPTYNKMLNDPSFTKITSTLSGPNHYPFETFAKAGANATPVQWPPFMTEALSSSATAFGPVMSNKQTLATAFTKFQSSLVKYAQQQGFKVSTSVG